MSDVARFAQMERDGLLDAWVRRRIETATDDEWRTFMGRLADTIARTDSRREADLRLEDFGPSPCGDQDAA